MKKGIFIEALPNKGPTQPYKKQNEQILAELRKKYEILTFHNFGHAGYQMTHPEPADRFDDIDFMITNIECRIFTDEEVAKRSAAKETRLEGLEGEAREEELQAIEKDFSSYKDTFDFLKAIRERYPKLKIVAYSAAHDPIRKKVYDEELVDAVHQRGRYGSFGSEMWHLIYGVERVLEGWRKCE